MQVFFGLLLAFSLVVVAFLFAKREWMMLARLKVREELPPDDWRHFRRQGIRRLVGCVLMVVLAMLIAGLFTPGILGEIDRLNAAGEAAKENRVELTEKEKESIWFAMSYTGVIALIVIVLLALAMFDLRAIRSYGMRHRRRISEDRRDMLQRQLPALKRSRNGHE